ncbi:hypothetical protein [Sphingomonas flavescens]|uniref:hypothetical protein n=1 Tax=Sphingomonas flavescens TaxID=3132797 RepID=UPI0028047C15|nr:hypothetical protein [Sphingomonas limnosediminicola]
MRKTVVALSTLIIAVPAAAQPVAPQLPPVLTDPASAQRLTGVLDAITDAVLGMRVGEVRAAIDGREPTPQERATTVRDMARRDDPDFDRHLHGKLAAVGPTIQQGAQAVNRALPEVMRSLDQAQRSIERAVANLPDPTYPRR